MYYYPSLLAPHTPPQVKETECVASSVSDIFRAIRLDSELLTLHPVVIKRRKQCFQPNGECGNQHFFIDTSIIHSCGYNSYLNVSESNEYGVETSGWALSLTTELKPNIAMKPHLPHPYSNI